MWEIVKRLWLGLALIGLAAAALLISDWPSRRGETRQGPIRIAILKHQSNLLLDESEQGLIDALARRGYGQGDRVRIDRFCAEGDLPTANMMAKQLTDGSYRMALTISTLSLQAVAGANTEGRVMHVFSTVTDPVVAKVGIRRMGTTEKPRYLAGFGSFQPVERAIRLARQFFPGLKVLGVVWNPGESNSEACVAKARAACKELGITLLEANAEQSRDVREAVESLIGRGVQAMWLGGDVAASSAIDAYADVVNRAGIALFTNYSGYVKKGTLFDLGANYYEVGSKQGQLAADILDGKVDPATVPVVDFMPSRLMLNEKIRRGLKAPWQFTAEALKQSVLTIGAGKQ